MGSEGWEGALWTNLSTLSLLCTLLRPEVCLSLQSLQRGPGSGGPCLHPASPGQCGSTSWGLSSHLDLPHLPLIFTTLLAPLILYLNLCFSRDEDQDTPFILLELRCSFTSPQRDSRHLCICCSLKKGREEDESSKARTLPCS